MRFTSFWISIAIAAALLFPATGQGAAPRIPVWTPLTPFETRTLQNTHLARSGDPDTLLALALMASGDIRDQKSYDRVRRHVRHFVKAHTKSLGDETSFDKKGEKLLHAMHAAFFAGGHKGGQHKELIEGYDSEQSQVSAIFKNGRFNCISSAILYMVLARYFDLHVEGVVTAHHAFIQIQGDNGRNIEVETTSSQGYGLIHDAAFYRKSFARFSRSRNLMVPTYADYLKRRVLPPYRFIAENMNHQHTAKERMNAADRQRLYEVIGFLDSDTAASQLIRLNALSNACVQLLGQRPRGDADRMFYVLEPVLKNVKSRAWIHRKAQSDIDKIWERIGSIHLMLGHLRLNADRFDEARRQYQQSQKWSRDRKLRRQADIGLLKSAGYEAFQKQRWSNSIMAYKELLPLINASDTRQVSATHENIAAAYWNWANTVGDRGDWTSAAGYYAATVQWTRDRDTKAKARYAKARAEAMHLMKQRQWEEAIQKFNMVLPSQKSANRKVLRTNVGTAYINWGNTLFNQQAYGEALDKYEAAFGVLQGDDRDLVIRNIAATYHNMTIPLLRAQKLDKAIAVLEAGVKRFPDCAPCRDELEDLHDRWRRTASR